jgi:predicted Fe-S protein YdhL (DUF1289 family)
MKRALIQKAENPKASSVPAEFSAQELARCLGVTKQAIHLRATKEQWSFTIGSQVGGRKKVFAFSDLPGDVRRRVLVHYGVLPRELLESVPSDMDASRAAACARGWDEALEWQRARARARLAVLEAMRRFMDERRVSRSKGVREFVRLFDAREVPGLEPEIYSEIRKARRTQLYEWEKRFKELGIAGLISMHGARRGNRKLSLQHQEFVLGLLELHPRWGATKLHKALEAKFSEVPSRATVGRWLWDWKRANPALYEAAQSPDGYKARFVPALGNASEKAERFLHYVEVDSTPADVMCADGRRYTVIGLIDVFSRKARFLVTSTSNSWGIAALLRSVIRDWGVPETLVRDNGQDYASRMVNDALQALGARVVAVPPFTPEGKPHIERVFRTLSHDLFERLPGYCGHNVEEREAIRSRRSFSERMAGKKAFAGGPTREELQSAVDDWTEKVYHQRAHGSTGASPNAKAASVPQRVGRIEDLRALDILLAPSGERVVGKKGVRYQNGLYWSDDLIDRIGTKARVRTDVTDAGRIFLFDPRTSRFICEARDLAISGLTEADYLRAKKTAKKRIREQVNALKKLAEGVGDPLADEIRRMRERRAAIRNLPVGVKIEDNPFIDGAIHAADAAERGTDVPAVERASLSVSNSGHCDPNHDDAGRPKVVDLPIRAPEAPVFANPRQRFEYLRKQRAIRPISPQEMEWLRETIEWWGDYAEMFGDQWSEDDRRWLVEIAPDRFGRLFGKMRKLGGV